ncbi:hypothetical protein ACFXPI_10930 [Streptomyces sp. NPDC059104]|uniref:hypothetical protein n=1 Tax=Streptomyces sp. NPDC059104 TaxID=3346729 RepID=UPI00369EE198
MAFPQTPIDLLAEMQIGGVWTDITGDLYARAPLTIQRGRQDEGARVDASRVSFQLNNRNNSYSPRNPRSANYRLIGRNTPVRFSVASSESYLATTGTDTDIVATPDHASIDITGDIDVRFEGTVRWYDAVNQTLIGKWSFPADGNRSWNLRLQAGQLVWVWSPTGLSADALAVSFVLPPLPRRAALRLTMDVDNGSSGRTIIAYWSDSLSGTWNTIGTITAAGTTSIFSGTAPLQIATNQSVLPGFVRLPFRGRLHRAEVRSGIGGSVVASPDVRALAVGTTSWVDSAGRTWTVAGAAAITNREYRLHAEVSSWPTRWDVSGRDVYVPVEASGILRRLGQGAKALASTLARRLPTQFPAAYWPMEDGKDSTQAYSPIVGCGPLVVSGFDFAQDASCPGSAALPKIGAAATMQGAVPTYSSPTSSYLISMIYQLDAPPPSLQTWLAFTTTGTVRTILVRYTSTTIEVQGYTAAGTQVIAESFSNSDTFGSGKWWRFDLAATTNGANTDFHMGWVEVNGAGSQWNWSTAGAPGRVATIDTQFGPDFSGMKVGHLAVFPSSDLSVWGGSDNGYAGETVSNRLLRLGGEESVPLSSSYTPTLMGAQRPASLLSLLSECEAADGGVMYEDRERLALSYRARTLFYTQPVALTLDYSVAGHVAPPLEPIDDDQRVRNDRTVTRTGGSSARSVDTTSPLSTQAPPLGVGSYDDAVTLNLYSDSQVQDIADWALHLGTWDEARYPTVHINLAAAPSLATAVLALDIGDRIQIINPPAWLPPGPIDLIVEGYTEVIGHPTDWDIVLNCSPAGPWSVAFADDTTYGRADTDGSVLGADATSTATTLVVHTTQTVDSSYPRWTQDPAELPITLELGGENVTASVVTTLAEDTYGRTVAAGGWGTASDGHTYTLTGGTGAERSVAGGLGLVTVTSTPTTLRMQTVAESCTDAEIRCTLSVSAVATGASAVSSVAMRWSSVTSCYRARIEWGLSGAISLSATVGSTLVDTSVSTGLTYAAGDQYEARVRLIGHRILMRIWRTGTIEPAGTWQLDRTVTSGTIASGQVGIGGGAFSGNTNVTQEYRFDNWAVESPQRVSVTRSVNGIVKAQVTGEDVRLAQPAITSY